MSCLLLVHFLHYLPNSPLSSADICKFRLARKLKLFFICPLYLVWYLKCTAVLAFSVSLQTLSLFDVFKKLQIINVELYYKIKHNYLKCYFILKKY